MTVSHTTFVIIDIVEMQKAEVNAGGMTFMRRPELDMYQIHAILKSYIEKTGKGRKILKKLGHGEHMTELDNQYMMYENAFTAVIPITHKALNENKYHVGGEIMIAYYPTTVYGEFHIKEEKKNGK